MVCIKGKQPWQQRAVLRGSLHLLGPRLTRKATKGRFDVLVMPLELERILRNRELRERGYELDCASNGKSLAMNTVLRGFEKITRCASPFAYYPITTPHSPRLQQK